MNSLDRINPMAHLVICWSSVPLMILFFIGMVPMSHFIPPPSPLTPAGEIAAFYANNLTQIRLGQLVAAMGFNFMFCWGCSIAVWTYRIEKGFPILTFSQLMGCAGGSALTFMIFLVWSVASFRAYPPETVQMLNDLGWFLFLWIVPPFSIWFGAMGWAILLDRSAEPIYPRWTAFICIWAAIQMLSTMLIAMFKEGPFAYNGILGFWLPVIAFFIWMIVMTIYTHKAIMRKVREQGAQA